MPSEHPIVTTRPTSPLKKQLSESQINRTLSGRRYVTVTGKKGLFFIKRAGDNNTRVASVTNPKETYLVANTLITEVSADARPQVVTIDPGIPQNMSPVDHPSSSSSSPVQTTPPQKSTAEIFKDLMDFTRCVARKYSNGLFVAGKGGTGKTYTVMETLQKMKLVEGTDYVVMKGYSTAAAIYNFLYDNLDKLIVLDDCDSIMDHPDALNIMKAVLDTSEIRRVSWNSLSNLIKVPSFDFKGRIIFISNRPMDKLNAHQEAVMTRVLTVVIQGTPEQMKDRCIELMPKMGKSISPAMREELIEYIKENYRNLKHLSLRWVVHLIAVRRSSPSNWKNLALSLR
jgi:hypothetical protein